MSVLGDKWMNQLAKWMDYTGRFNTDAKIGLVLYSRPYVKKYYSSPGLELLQSLIEKKFISLPDLS